MSPIKLTITSKHVVGFLRKDYTCPFDFCSRYYDGSKHYLKIMMKVNKIFNCNPKGIKVPVIHLPCDRAKIGVKRNSCWKKLIDKIELKGEKNEEVKKEKKEKEHKTDKG